MFVILATCSFSATTALLLAASAFNGSPMVTRPADTTDKANAAGTIPLHKE